jgi:hypothetical protein
MSEKMRFDMSDVRVRWQLYRYNNRRHDGEVWLVLSTPNGVMLMEQSGRFPDDSTLLGEVQTRMFDGELVHEIVPLQQRSEVESRRMQQQAELHKAYRAELYERYSFTERMADLNDINLIETKRDKRN